MGSKPPTVKNNGLQIEDDHENNLLVQSLRSRSKVSRNNQSVFPRKLNKVRVGVIGCGYWGQNLIRNFAKLKGCELVGVADLDPGRLAFTHRLYPKLKMCPSAENLIHEAGINTVAIVTPVSTHYTLAKMALQRGKHVLLEKPMATTVSEAEELTHLARQLHRVLMIDHTFVFSGAVLKVREFINSGKLGKIYYYDSVRVNLGLFQQDVDVLWDLGPHDFSIMTYLLDKKVRSVSAIGACPVRQGTWNRESIVYVAIRFHDETLAHFHLNWLSPVKIRRTLIGGSRKMVVYDHLDPDNQVKIFNKGIRVKTDKSRPEILIQYRMGDMYAPKVDQTEALEKMCQHFVECIRYDKTPVTDGQTGVEVVRLLQAAEQSTKQLGKVVEL